MFNLSDERKRVFVEFAPLRAMENQAETMQQERLDTLYRAAAFSAKMAVMAPDMPSPGCAPIDPHAWDVLT